MIPRYSRPEMNRVWSDDRKFELWLKVEVAAVQAWGVEGVAPASDVAKVVANAKVDVAAVNRYIEETHHDVTAFLRSVAESLGPESRWVHYGLTSNDVWDTATCLQMVEALDLITTGVVRLREVPLWFSPGYPGVRPRAEYHPDAGWLRANQRNPAMARAVEFTNIRIFAAEARRMPNFALHELAHAFHDRVLGFEQPDIKAAYEQAKAGGKYDRVERQDSEGRKRFDRAYALTNHKEYFAETTEAFFSRNDFFPFTRAELEAHDPEMFKLLERLWKCPSK